MFSHTGGFELYVQSFAWKVLHMHRLLTALIQDHDQSRPFDETHQRSHRLARNGDRWREPKA